MGKASLGQRLAAISQTRKEASERQLHIGAIYQHFKGGRYLVLHLGKHSETKEDLVIYQGLTDGRVWARPLGMFMGKVLDGGAKWRFEEVLDSRKEARPALDPHMRSMGGA